MESNKSLKVVSGLVVGGCTLLSVAFTWQVGVAVLGALAIWAALIYYFS